MSNLNSMWCLMMNFPQFRSRGKAQYLQIGQILCNAVNLTLSANHPVHPCAPSKCSAHEYTQNCARIHRESPEDAHARAQHHTITPNFSDQ